MQYRNRTPAELVEYAGVRKHGKRAAGFVDDKCFCFPDEICGLVLAGAQRIKTNAPSLSSSFVHEVIYKGFRFVASTETRLPYLEARSSAN